MVRLGLARHGKVRSDGVGLGVAWSGGVRYGVAWYGVLKT